MFDSVRVSVSVQTEFVVAEMLLIYSLRRNIYYGVV
jgi:hypothetical protein